MLIAYLDPGTGSMMIQVLIGFCVAALVIIKIYWVRIKNLCRKILSRHAQQNKSKE